MISSNPFDAMEIARDMVKRDECTYLFNEILAEDKQVGVEVDEYYKGYKEGLRFAMDLLDGRIGHLRDRWG
jgi:hypothetical protein